MSLKVSLLSSIMKFRLGHPDAREFLLNINHSQEPAWYEVKESAQQEISNACFLYLSTLEVQDSAAESHAMPSKDLLRTIPFGFRHNLHSYVVKYWPRHYKLIPTNCLPLNSALDFLKDTKAIRLWWEAYWSLSNPITRTNRGFRSLLPILANLGLTDLATRHLETMLKNETPDIIEDAA